jgi:hypothetical protein
MKTLNIFSIILFSSSILFSQEMAGFELSHKARYIGDFKTQSRVGMAGYRYYNSYGTRVGLYIGVNQFKFLNDNKKSVFLESPSELILKTEFHQVISALYLRGSAEYYRINGEIDSPAEGTSNLIYDSHYDMFEFPIGLGITVNQKNIRASAGLLKTYFYGTHETEVFVDTEGNKANLGTSSKRSFDDELPLAGELNVIYSLSKLLDVELNYIQFSKKDFAIQISLWSPI